MPHSVLTSEAIDWIRERVPAFLSRLGISEHTFMALLALGVGVMSGLGNFIFRKTIDLIHLLVIEQGVRFFHISFEQWSAARFWSVLFPVTAGVLMIPFGLFFAKDLRFGFSHFLERVNLRGAKIPGRTIVTRGLASAITLGAGGSAGQEGPIAQIGGAIGSQVGQLFKVSGERLKLLVACGVAGGIAATFNAPIAGVFFAHEIVLLSSFELTSFTSIVISSGIATVVSRALLGNMPALRAPVHMLAHPWELAFYLVLGMLVGVLAVGFTTAHYRIVDRLAALKVHRLVKPIVGGALVGIIGIFFPQVFGNGYEFIENVLLGEGVLLLLGCLVLAKALATSLTLGSGLPGGMFAPSLFIGAVTGGAYGKALQILFPGTVPATGPYALVGMGAFLAAATHAPMTAIFLLFEMTGSYDLIIPIMLCCVVGTAISRHLKKDSLDTVELSRAGINLEAGKERNIMKSLRVGDVMTRDPESIPENMTLRQFNQFIASTKHTNFPLINRNGGLTGIISVQDFLGVVFEGDLFDLVVVKELATLDVVTVSTGDNLDQAMRKIGYRNIEQLPVVDERNGRKLIGIVSRRDMVSAYNRALMVRSMEDDDDE
ncbi:chloride channel protein [Syntrophotalea carbinolica]|nr:chloride channel protein [Syntrophotalea carbinolica]